MILCIIILCLISLFMVIDFFEKIDDFIEYHASFSSVIKYLSCHILVFSSSIIPVSCLLSSIITIGLMDNNLEVTALKAAGISSFRASAAIIFMSLFLSGITFMISELAAPHTNEMARRIWIDEIKSANTPTMMMGSNLWYRDDDMIFHIGLIAPHSSTGKNITIIMFRPGTFEPRTIIYAKNATLANNKWLLEDILIKKTTHDGFNVSPLKSFEINASITIDDFLDNQKKMEDMGFFQLYKLYKRFKNSGLSTMEMKLNIYNKMIFPLSCITLGILGICLGLGTAKYTGLIFASVIGVVVAFSYWITVGFSNSLGLAGSMHLMISSILPHVLAAGASIFFYLRIPT